jgi:hypothetical protein
MIKVYTSYFYQVRNMREDCLAFSTAAFDPAWFHKGTKDNKTTFIDKNGTLNGLRAEPFCPLLDLPDDEMCSGREGCKHLELDLPWHCNFLIAYGKKLNELDPKEIEQRFLRVGEAWRAHLNKPDLEITYILLVHEAPTNPCSERVMLQKWLKENGFGGEEWQTK